MFSANTKASAIFDKLLRKTKEVILKFRHIFTLSLTTISSYGQTCSPIAPPYYVVSTASVFFNECCDKSPKFMSYDSQNFKFLNHAYVVDSEFAYYLGKKIEGAQASSFQLIESHKNNYYSIPYAKDKNYVYYEGQPIKEAQSSSFELVKNNNIFAHDKNSFYFKGKKFNLFAPQKSKNLWSHYWADGKNLFYFDTSEESSNIISISTNFNGKYRQINTYFITKDGVFKDGLKTKFDAQSFGILGIKKVTDSCASEDTEHILQTDKNGTYLDSKKLPIQLTLFNNYTNLYISKEQIVYSFSNNDTGLIELGSAKNLRFIENNRNTLIQVRGKTYMLMSDRVSELTNDEIID